MEQVTNDEAHSDSDDSLTGTSTAQSIELLYRLCRRRRRRLGPSWQIECWAPLSY